MVQVTRLAHVGLQAQSLSTQAEFYNDRWGLERVDEFGREMFFRADGPDHHVLTLTEGDRSVVRVALLTRLCGALYYSPRRQEMTQLAAEATDLAAELGDPEALALAAASRRRAYWDPAQLDQRLADSTELLTLARQAGDLELVLQGHAWLVVDLLEQGQSDAVDAQIEAFTEEVSPSIGCIPAA